MVHRPNLLQSKGFAGVRRPRRERSVAWRSLIPREERFYHDFQAMAEQLERGARMLEEMLAPERPVWDKADEIKEVEHIIEELNDLTPDFHQKLVDLFLERLRAHEFADDDEKSLWTERLQEFLKTSTNYNTMRVFRQLPSSDPDYYEPRAIVLSKMGSHKQALHIYVFDMKDYAKAEE